MKLKIGIMKYFNDIPGSNNWNIIELINKGWSDGELPTTLKGSGFKA